MRTFHIDLNTIKLIVVVVTTMVSIKITKHILYGHTGSLNLNIDPFVKFQWLCASHRFNNPVLSDTFHLQYMFKLPANSILSNGNVIILTTFLSLAALNVVTMTTSNTTRQIWGIWKLRPAYSPETPNLGQNRWCFVPCDLEIWWMTLENNRAPLLCCFKLCATFHSHRWIQTGVAVRKRPIWVKFDDF